MSAPTDPDTERGAYNKFQVARRDGSSGPGGKHEHCETWVLDFQHDPFAVPALRAYADACRAKYPRLAADLDAKLADMGEEPPTFGAGLTRAQLAHAVDTAHDHLHQGDVEAAHEALHQLGGASGHRPRVGCGTGDPEVQRAVADLLRLQEREIPCGHTIADLDWGGPGKVTRCCACIVEQRKAKDGPAGGEG